MICHPWAPGVWAVTGPRVSSAVASCCAGNGGRATASGGSRVRASGHAQGASQAPWVKKGGETSGGNELLEDNFFLLKIKGPGMQLTGKGWPSNALGSTLKKKEGCRGQLAPDMGCQACHLIPAAIREQKKNSPGQSPVLFLCNVCAN